MVALRRPPGAARAPPDLRPAMANAARRERLRGRRDALSPPGAMGHPLPSSRDRRSGGGHRRGPPAALADPGRPGRGGPPPGLPARGPGRRHHAGLSRRGVRRLGDNAYQIAPGRAEDYRRLVAEIPTAEIEQVVHLWSLDTEASTQPVDWDAAAHCTSFRLSARAARRAARDVVRHTGGRRRGTDAGRSGTGPGGVVGAGGASRPESTRS